MFLASFAQKESFSGWTQVQNYPGGGLEKGIAFTIGEYGYAGMGSDNTGYRKDFWRYSFMRNDWMRMLDFPGTPRISAVGFAIGTKGYVGTGMTGADNNKQVLKDLWEFDPEKNAWSQKADLPGEGRYGAIGFSLDNKGYIALGAGKTSVHNDTWEYDPSSNQWKKMADFPDNGRSDASVFIIGPEAYVLFGQGRELFPTKKISWKFNAAKNEWKSFAEFPDSPRSGVIAFAYGNKGFCLGGTGGPLKKFEDLWEYDSVRDKWYALSEFPFKPCSYSFSFVYGKNAWVSSGKIKVGTPGVEFWKYDFTDPAPAGSMIIGGSLQLGDERIPLAGIEVKITDTKGKVIKSAYTNLFGSFLFTGLPEKEDLIFSFDSNDPGWKDEKFVLVNKKNEIVAVLNKENKFMFYLNAASRSKVQLIRLENKNLRMNMKGRLVLDDKKKTPLAEVGVAMMNEDEEIVQAAITGADGAFTFDYLPVDSTVYLSVDEKMVKKLARGEKIMLMDEGDKLVSKTPSSHPEFALPALPPEKSTLTKVYMEDAWAPFLSGNPPAESKVVEPIYFESGKADLLPAAKGILNKAIALLKSNPAFTIEIVAHTDARGDEKKNMELSEKRAQSARDYMIAKGVKPEQITAKGLGETQPVNKCKDGVTCTEEEHAQNRRMEFVIRR